jgi:hypothetical protein
LRASILYFFEISKTIQQRFRDIGKNEFLPLAKISKWDSFMLICVICMTAKVLLVGVDDHRQIFSN